MSGPTKADLERQIAQLQEQLSNSNAEKDKLAAQVTRAKAGMAGWVITTPNSAYSGKTFGVDFLNGRAIIPINKKFPKVQARPLKPAAAEKLGYTEADLAAIAERSAIPDADKVAVLFMTDYGYDATRVENIYDVAAQPAILASPS